MKKVCLLLLFAPLFSFSQDYNFEHFGEKELKANFFYDFDQDSRGRLYVASSKGLIIYDGIQFKLLNEKDSLLDEFVHKVFIDDEDQVWVAYYKGGVSRMNQEGIKHFSGDMYIRAFYEDSQSQAHLLTDEGSYQISNDGLKEDKKHENLLEIATFSKGGQVVLNEENTLYFINNDVEKHLHDEVQFVSNNNGDYPLLVVTSTKIHVYNAFPDGSPRLEISASYDELGIDSDVTTALMTSDKAILGTKESGLFEVYLNPGFQSYSIKNFNAENGLLDGKINCLFLDQEGSTWIGSYGDGISLLPKKRISTHGVLSEKKANRIHAIEYYNGVLYVGSEFGLRTLDMQTLVSFPELENKTVFDLKAQGDTLWVGTSQGLFFIENQKIEKVHFEGLQQQPTKINCIQFYESSLFVATNDGLYSYNLLTNESLHITTIDGLAHNVIEHFIITKDRTFWFDSPNSPIYSYANEEFQYHKDIPGFTTFNLSDIHEAANGDIWFSTEGDGIFKLEDGAFHQFNVNQGLYSDIIYFLDETADGKLICGHKSGVSLIDLENNEAITNLGMVPELEYILPNSAYVSASNYLWVGTSFGAVRIPEINVFETPYAPEIYFSSIKVNHETQPSDKPIRLEYGNYYLEIGFEAIMLNNSKSISFKYKLEGFDQDWTYVANDDANARYQSIKDGEYTFKVQLLMNEQEVGDQINIEITVEKPYWKETWFYIVLFILILIVFFIALWIVNRRNRAIQSRLQAEVNTRTLDLVEKNREIVSINNELEILMNQYLDQKNVAEMQTQLMTESINYARNIQKVLLRRQEYADWISVFNDFFLLFKPKDLVSGDFYWGHKTDKYSYVSVADCTGHGVPGAMISMLGASFLHDVVQEENDTDQILNKLRDKIVSGFNQNEDTGLYDGMDISLLRMDNETLMAQYSGAMNPMFLVRSKNGPTPPDFLKPLAQSSTSIIYTSSADRQPVAFYYVMKEFSKYEFQLCKGDQIYLSSDGYIDQFGGATGKKFMRKNFVELLLSISYLGADEQKNLLWNTMTDWQGSHEQIDDITVIGLRV